VTLFFATAARNGRPVDLDRLKTAGPVIAGAGDAPPALAVAGDTGWIQVPFHCTPGGDGGLDHADTVTVLGEFRLDDRKTLASVLAARGHAVEQDVSDARLVRAAYAEWGLDFATRLHGEYGLVILDRVRRHVVMAVDAFSTVPVYWSAGPDGCWVSNWLDARILAGPATLIDDDYVCDYLLFGSGRDLSATIHTAIRRVPPASLAVLPMDGGPVRIDRHWSPPDRTQSPLRRPAADWAEGLAYHLDQAVIRRLGDGASAFTLTAGLDSSMALAMAVRHRQTGAGHRLRAYCVGYDWLLPDEERLYASFSADHLGVDLVTRAVDDIQGGSWRRSFRPRPEPRLLGMRRSSIQPLFEQAEADGFRVMLSGFGGDVVVGGRRPRLAEMLAPHHLRTAWNQRHLSVTMKRALLRSMLKRPGPRQPQPVPAAMAPDFARRMDAAGRLAADARGGPDDLLARMTADPFWVAAISLGRPEFTGCRLRIRHPYFDTDLIDYMAGVPVWPFSVEKAILRLLARQHLPEAVTSRRKYALIGSPPLVWARRRPEVDIDTLFELPFLSGYVRSPVLSGKNQSLGNERANFFQEYEYPLGFSAWMMFHVAAED